jgi:hypothetical protein
MEIMRVKWFALFMIITLSVAGCNSLSADCPPNTIIEWVDMLKINDIKYQHDFLDEPDDFVVETGKKIGEVSYEMADDACANHKMKNGHAAYLRKGTPIYEIKGYPASLMVYAGGMVFLVDENEKAKTVGEKYAVEGKVKNVVFLSTMDGALNHTFSEDAKETFLKEWLSLELFNPMDLANEDLSDRERVFIGIELQKGVIFQETYWTEKNVFSREAAYGTKELQRIIKSELTNIIEK